MNRREFVAVSAGAVAVSSTGAVAGVLGKQPKVAGQRVTLSGWILPGAAGPGHYFVLGPHSDIADQRAGSFEQWPEGLTLVYPANADALRAGKVTLEGRLRRGRFKDEVTGHMARAVLTDARPV